MAIVIENKFSFKVGEVSKYLGVPQHQIRYWTDNFPGIKPELSGTTRLYSRNDIERLAYIKQLLSEEHLTIEGAKKKYALQQETGELSGIVSSLVKVAGELEKCENERQADTASQARSHSSPHHIEIPESSDEIYGEIEEGVEPTPVCDQTNGMMRPHLPLQVRYDASIRDLSARTAELEVFRASYMASQNALMQCQASLAEAKDRKSVV